MVQHPFYRKIKRSRHFRAEDGGAPLPPPALRTDSPWCVPLSALRRGDALPPVPDAAQRTKLRALAAEFAGELSREQAELVLLRFFEYFSLWCRFEGMSPRYLSFGPGGTRQILDGRSILDFWTVAEPGKLRYLTREWIQLCDTGQGQLQELSFSQYCILQRISEEELLHAHATCGDYVTPEGVRHASLDPNNPTTNRDLCWSWDYGGHLPGTDCPVFQKDALYLYHPFGLRDCFLLYTYIR